MSLSNEEKLFINNIDVEFAYEITKSLVEMSLHKIAGTGREHQAADWIKSKMKEIGLQNVRKEPFPVYVRDISKGAELSIIKPIQRKIFAFPMPSTYPTKPDGITGELVYVNHGYAEDFSENVEGKIVLLKRVYPDMIGEEGYFRSRPILESYFRGVRAAIVFDERAPKDIVRSQIYLISPLRFPVVTISFKDASFLQQLLDRYGSIEVNVKSFIQEPMPGTSYNVIGEIKGRKYPDQYVILSAHYDTWWHGAVDNLSGVGCILAIAKAIIDSNIHPDRSMIFVVHGAEEEGWPCLFGWAVGSYFNIHVHHPDWAGNSVCLLNIDCVGFDESSCNVESSPELYKAIKKVVSDIGMKPASLHHQISPSKMLTYTDSSPYLFEGIPYANITYWKDEYWDYYHTQSDNMDLLTKKCLLWTIKLWGVTSLRFSRSSYIPFSISYLADSLLSRLREGQKNLSSIGLSEITFSAVIETLQRLKELSQSLEDKIMNLNEKVKSYITTKMLDALMEINRNIYLVGGITGIDAYFLPDPYIKDVVRIKSALDSINKDELKQAVVHLENTYLMVGGKHMSYKSYKYYKDVYLREGLLWGIRLQRYTDVYKEWDLLNKSKNKENLPSVVRSLDEKMSATLSELKSTLASVDRVMKTAITFLQEELEID